MDRMVIATRQLKGGEERVRLGPGWYVEGLADGEILEVAGVRDFFRCILTSIACGAPAGTSVQLLAVALLDARLGHFGVHSGDLIGEDLAERRINGSFDAHVRIP